jgi:hypothetical protein
VLAHRLAADAFHQLKGLVAMLFADDLAQQPAQQADGGTVSRGILGSSVMGLPVGRLMVRVASKGRRKKRPAGKIVGLNSTMAMLPLDYIEFFVFLAALCLVGFSLGGANAVPRLTIF